MNNAYDQDIIDYIRIHGASSPGRLMFFMDRGDAVSMGGVDDILTRLVAENRLIVSINGLIFRLPWGHHQVDYQFNIREAKMPCGMSVWGVVWKVEGESWSWSAYDLALDYARLKLGVGV